ncbi:MAG TPA: serine/threonine-protein kinase [Polyangiaceae bacterium]|nr:serine/threonine-protein kinase [Polyangiaceae bacterium]
MGSFTPGQSVAGLAGVYVVEGTHGEGGFGVTYRARRQETGEMVLLKELRIDRLKTWKALELFEREAGALRHLSHPSIPAYYDFFAYGGGAAAPPATLSTLASLESRGPVTLVLVQQFIAGDSLQQAIEGGLRWTGAEVESFLRQMLAVLAYLHELNPPVVHRDISPKNVILARGGQAHLVDFGAIQDRIRTSSSIASTAVGTMGFMPLEQLMGAARPASDLYALAMTVVAAISGLSPTELPTDDKTGKLQLGPIVRGLPAGVQRALDGMSEPIVGNRLQSARAALAVLDGRATSRGRTLRAALGATVALALGGGAMTGLLLARRTSHAPRAAVGSAGPARVAPAASAHPEPAPAPSPEASPQASPEASPAAPPEPSAEPPAAPAAGAATAGEAVTIVWRGKVSGSNGRGGPLRGAPCVLRVDVKAQNERLEASDVRLLCGGKKLYDSSDELNGMSSTSYAVTEVAVPRKDGAFRYALRYLDQGPRTGERNQISLDTRAREATVVKETPPAFRTLVRLEELSDEREGPRLVPPREASFAGAIELGALALVVRGDAPIKRGDACTLRVEPEPSGPHNCRAKLTCGGAVLYGGGEGGYNDCPVRGGRPTGFIDRESSPVDGDAKASVDLLGGRAWLSDETLEASYRVDFSLR